MLKQLENLSIEADGRFATADELQFLKDYLATADQRVSAYEAVREAEEAIIDAVSQTAQKIEPDIFRMGDQDTEPLFRRDRQHILKWSAATMLMGDLDRLRDGLLLWHRTIMKAVKQQHASEVVSNLFPQVIAEVLPAEATKLLMPAIHLQQTILG